MRYFILCFSMTLLFCCGEKRDAQPSKVPTVETKGEFDWLLGNWQRTNSDPGEETFEIWKKHPNHYQGHGFTMKGRDTSFQEQMKIHEMDDHWVFEVRTSSDAGATLFPIIKRSADKFLCENKSNDFPNLIEYYREGDLLKANISNDEMAIPFIFKPISGS